MPRPKKSEHAANMQEAIKETAWKQIAEHGAPALSLRNIARELGITAPAIYNYYPSRDDLVTALIIDAFTSFGDWQIEARDAVPRADTIGRFKAIGMAYRGWALRYPQRYQLIFGTPIPGYEPPAEQIFPASARSLSALVSVVDALRIAGRLQADPFPQVQDTFKISYEQWKSVGGDFGLLSLSVAVLIWSRVHGLVSLELGGKIPPFGAQGDELYLYELESIKKQFILEAS